jgi:hypothetical protein
LRVEDDTQTMAFGRDGLMRQLLVLESDYNVVPSREHFARRPVSPEVMR